jgi:predicted alpha-1,2-mannosidase
MMRRTPAAACLVLCLLNASAPQRFARAEPRRRAAAVGEDLAQYVNPFVGTEGDGNTFPGATVPFGMVQWSPDTKKDGFYRYKETTTRGFSLTHLSGAGCPAYGDFPFLPVVGPLKDARSFRTDSYAASFSHDRERASPGSYTVELDNGVRAELTATARTGAGVFAYPKGAEAGLLIVAGGSATGNSASSVRVVGDREVEGSATSGAFCDSKSTYTVYFAAAFERPFKSSATWREVVLSRDARAADGQHTGAHLTFDTSQNQAVRVKVGLSFVSAEGARKNLLAENPDWDFEGVRRKARAVWNDWLGRVRVEGGTHEQKRVFYTALYHSLIAPNVFSDADGRYVGFDRKVHEARGYTHYANFSDWDTYRTVVQLHALLAPRETSDMMRSLVAAADESGYLPKWPLANDVTAVMGGDNPVPLVATAYAFGARGFDARSAYRYMLKAATRPGQGIHGYEERPRLAEYLERGYIPLKTFNWDDGVTGSASATLEYATDDFCVARMAEALGDRDNARLFMRRAQNWQNLFDAEIGFARPRRVSGVFLEGFDVDKVLPHSEASWDRASQAGFEEGNSWQYTWMVPHNFEGLFAAVGGKEEAVRRLDRFFGRMTGWGHPHFNIANEPSFVTPYAYTFAGCPDRTQATVRRTLSEIFNSTPSGLPGNDDLGATSAWYVWGALGLYPAVPAVGGFVVSSPLFPAATLRLGDGRRVRLTTARVAAGGVYVRSLMLDGAPYRSAWLPLSALKQNATTTLAFTLSDRPDTGWATSPEDAPPSFTEGQAPAIAYVRGEDSVSVQPGGGAAFALGVRRVVPGPLKIGWRAEPTGGLRPRPAEGVVEVGPDGTPDIRMRVDAESQMRPGVYVLPIRLTAGGADLPPTVLEVKVGAASAGRLRRSSRRRTYSTARGSARPSAAGSRRASRG